MGRGLSSGELNPKLSLATGGGGDPLLKFNPLLYLAAGDDNLAAGGSAAGYRGSVATWLDRGPNGLHLTQGNASYQPTMLPKIGGRGYLNSSGTTGNYLSLSGPALDAGEDFELEVEATQLATSNFGLVSAGAAGDAFYLHSSGGVYFRVAGGTLAWVGASVVGRAVYKLVRDSSGDSIELFVDGVSQGSKSLVSTDSWASLTTIGAISAALFNANGAVHRVTLDESLAVDFENAPHQGTSFTAESGQLITANRSGTNPAAFISKPVVRPDGSDDTMGKATALIGGSDILLSVYTDLTTGTRGVRQSTITSSDVFEADGVTSELAVHAADLECLYVLPAASGDVTAAKAVLANRYNATVL